MSRRSAFLTAICVSLVIHVLSSLAPAARTTVTWGAHGAGAAGKNYTIEYRLKLTVGGAPAETMKVLVSGQKGDTSSEVRDAIKSALEAKLAADYGANQANWPVTVADTSWKKWGSPKRFGVKITPKTGNKVDKPKFNPAPKVGTPPVKNKLQGLHGVIKDPPAPKDGLFEFFGTPDAVPISLSVNEYDYLLTDAAGMSLTSVVGHFAGLIDNDFGTVDSLVDELTGYGSIRVFDIPLTDTLIPDTDPVQFDDPSMEIAAQIDQESLDYQLTIIPEPATLTLLTTAAAYLYHRRRQRKTQTS